MQRTTQRLSRTLTLLLACSAILHGCDCTDDAVGPVAAWECAEMGRRPGAGDEPCGGEQRYVKGQCQPVRCDAGEQAAGCCPGMLCTQGGECVVPPSRMTPCESDGNCQDGQRCLERPAINAASRTCGFPPVDANGACPDGGQPFNRRCVAGSLPPCDGDCPPGSVCNIDTNRCEEPPVLTNQGHGCDQECGAAQILVYSDPDGMLWDQCCAVTCECLTLPAVVPGNWGRYSDLAVDASNIVVSAYDGTYGDLVMARYATTDGTAESLAYVDGIPAGGAVVADPNGPRGGMKNPGPNVGEYTSVALANGAPRTAYYDVDGANLKYAAWDASSESYTVSLIDDGRDATGADVGDVGRYASLVLDSRGVPHVTYYAHRARVGGVLVSGLFYARGLTAKPAGYDDWERTPVEIVPSCNNACLDAELCVREGASAACHLPSSSCETSCPCDSRCVDNAGQPECRELLPQTLTEPCDGSCPDGFACVTDGSNGSVCLRKLADACGGSCGADDLCVDDGNGQAICRLTTPYSTLAGLPEGLGLFSSLGLHQGVPVVAYYDRLRKHLRAAVAEFAFDEGINRFAAAPLVCDPVLDHGQYVSLAIAPDGNSVAVAFQTGAGELALYRGGDFATGSVEIVDDGLRDGRLSVVGGSVSLAFNTATGRAYLAYHDQTENDLMLAYERSDAWAHATLLSDGAYGSYARLAILNGTLYTSTYLWERDAMNRDTSRLVLVLTDLSTLSDTP